jgi:hypothetical protein
MRRTVRQFFPAFSARGGKALPLSTLLLAALCMVLAAPSSQAAAREYSPHAAILSVLQRGEAAASLSQLEARQLHAILSTLDKTQLAELGQHLAALEIATRPDESPVVFSLISAPAFYSSLEPHLAAQLCGVRTNAYLE